MNIEEFRTYCLSKKGATESIPFSKLPDLLVFKVMNKMFTAIDLSSFDGFTIKCDPETIEEFREQYDAVQEPPYMSRKHWSWVQLDGTIPDKLIKEWLDTSYNLVVAGLPKKIRTTLSNS